MSASLTAGSIVIGGRVGADLVTTQVWHFRLLVICDWVIGPNQSEAEPFGELHAPEDAVDVFGERGADVAQHLVREVGLAAPRVE